MTAVLFKFYSVVRIYVNYAMCNRNVIIVLVSLYSVVEDSQTFNQKCDLQQKCVIRRLKPSQNTLVELSMCNKT